MALGYFPGTSYLHRLDPRPKIFLMFIFIIFSMFFTDPIYCAVIFLGMFVLSLACGVGWTRIKGIIVPILPLLLFYGIFNLPFNPVTLETKKDPANIWFHLIPFTNYMAVTGQGFIYALAMLIRFLVIVYAIQLVMMVTQVVDMTTSLTKWKLPASVAIAISIGFSFIPVLVDTISTIRAAQTARGSKGIVGNPISRLRALVQLLIPVFLATVGRAQQIAVAIEARGFGYNISKRTFRREMRLKKIDYGTFLAEALLCGGMVYLSRLGYGQWQFSWGLLLKYWPVFLDFINSLGI